MAAKPGLLAVAREKMRARHFALRTEQSYLQWIRRYIRFHPGKHPRELGATGVEQFLTHLANDRKVSAATQNQALHALLFLYRNVLGIELPWLNITRAQTHKHLPVVLTRMEVRSLLSGLEGTPWLVANLLYGSGLRLMECLRLRVKDVLLERGEVIVREGKGGKDRVTMLPASLEAPLRTHLDRLREWYQEERRRQRPGVSLPAAPATPRRLIASGAGTQIPAGKQPVGVAIPVSGLGGVLRPFHGRPGAPSFEREGHPARGGGRGPQGRDQPARKLPYAAPLFRYTPARGRL
jgi:integrase